MECPRYFVSTLYHGWLGLMSPSSPVVILPLVILLASWNLILHITSLIFSQRLKETHFQPFGAHFLYTFPLWYSALQIQLP